MALYKGILCAFEYCKGWLTEGFSISPFLLPLEKGVFMQKIDPFGGLFGVFADGWLDLLAVAENIGLSFCSNFRDVEFMKVVDSML